MKKLRIALPLVTFLYLFIGTFFFMSSYSADEMSQPEKPIFYGWGMYAYLDESSEFTAELFNSPINQNEFPDNPDAWIGQSICSVETSLSFPTDLLEVQSASFTVNEDNNYSNETGKINFKSTYSSCNTNIYLTLFTVTFKTKKLGEGTINFLTHVIKGGSDKTTVIQDDTYDSYVSIVPVEEYNPDPNPNPPIPNPSPNPNPRPRPNPNPSPSPSPKPAPKPVNSSFKTPTLSKLEFGATALLDKPNAKSQGVVFTGTAEPNSKVYLLLNSQSEIYTDTTSGADGSWTKTIDSWLEDGSHTITVWSEKDNKISPKFVSPFVVSSYAKNQIAIGDTYPEYKGPDVMDPSLTTKKETKLNTIMKNKYFWAYVGGGLLLIIISIVLIIKSRRKKDDSDNNDLSGDGGFINQSAMPPKSSEGQESNGSIYPNTDI